MWYRLYLGKIPKEQYEEMISLSKEELIKKYWDSDDTYLPWPYKWTTLLHEFWKYVDYSEWMNDFEFKDEDVQEYYSEYSLQLVDESVLLKIVDEYAKNVADYYLSLIDWKRTDTFLWRTLSTYKLKRKDKMKEIFKHLQQRYYNFSNKRFFIKKKKWYKSAFGSLPYSKDKTGDIVTSWEYEYQIFNLLRIYQEHNPETEVLIYYWY